MTVEVPKSNQCFCGTDFQSFQAAVLKCLWQEVFLLTLAMVLLWFSGLSARSRLLQSRRSFRLRGRRWPGWLWLHSCKFHIKGPIEFMQRFKLKNKTWSWNVESEVADEIITLLAPKVLMWRTNFDTKSYSDVLRRHSQRTTPDPPPHVADIQPRGPHLHLPKPTAIQVSSVSQE